MQKKNLYLVLLSSLGFVAGSANAALPAEATAALTASTTAVADASAGVWPVIAASLVAMLIVKMVKRFFSKI